VSVTILQNSILSGHSVISQEVIPKTSTHSRDDDYNNQPITVISDRGINKPLRNVFGLGLQENWTVRNTSPNFNIISQSMTA
jgi:hypothetical protein